MGELENAKKEYQNIEIPKELNDMVEETVKKSRIMHEHEQKESKNKKTKFKAGKIAVAAVAAVAVVFTVGLNTNSVFAATMQDVPGIGGIAKVLTFRSYEEVSEDQTVIAEIPGVTVNRTEVSKTAFSDAVNAQIQEKCDAYIQAATERVKEYKEAFLSTGGTEEEFAQKNIVIQVDYQIKNQTENVLSFVVTGTESWNSAYDITEYYNLDLTKDAYLSLKDLLGSDYVAISNRAIKAQMALQEAQSVEPVVYWTEAEGGFSTVDDNTNFYVNEEGLPVVVFDKYEVAPGAMGEVEFVIDPSVDYPEMESSTQTQSNETASAEWSDAAAFAGQIKTAFDEKNLQSLSELCAYPMYLGLGDGIEVEQAKDILALETSEVFSTDMINMLDAADFSTLEETQAGYILGDGKPNIIFNQQEQGNFKITGINY